MERKRKFILRRVTVGANRKKNHNRVFSPVFTFGGADISHMALVSQLAPKVTVFVLQFAFQYAIARLLTHHRSQDI